MQALKSTAPKLRASPQPHKKRVGTFGEQAAQKYLNSFGMRFIRSNWRCRAGEIDLVFQDGPQLVFVEVKSRVYCDNTDSRMALFQSITEEKKRRLRLLVELYLRFYYQRRAKPPVRIDVVGVLLTSDGRHVAHIEHIRAAV